MPQVDAKLLFSDDQAETTVAAHDSTNTIDIGVATPNFGGATPKWVNIILTAAIVGTTSTVSFGLYDSADHSSWTQVWATPAIAEATLVKGWSLPLAIPAEIRRYLKMVYTIAVNVLTAGTISSWISLTPVRTVT